MVCCWNVPNWIGSIHIGYFSIFLIERAARCSASNLYYVSFPALDRTDCKEQLHMVCAWQVSDRGGSDWRGQLHMVHCWEVPDWIRFIRSAWFIAAKASDWICIFCSIMSCLAIILSKESGKPLIIDPVHTGSQAFHHNHQFGQVWSRRITAHGVLLERTKLDQVHIFYFSHWARFYAFMLLIHAALYTTMDGCSMDGHLFENMHKHELIDRSAQWDVEKGLDGFRCESPIWHSDEWRWFTTQNGGLVNMKFFVQTACLWCVCQQSAF